MYVLNIRHSEDLLSFENPDDDFNLNIIVFNIFRKVNDFNKIQKYHMILYSECN